MQYMIINIHLHFVFIVSNFLNIRTKQTSSFIFADVAIFIKFSATLCWMLHLHTHSTNRNDEVLGIFPWKMLCSSFYCSLTFDMEPIILRNTKRISPYLRVINVIKRRYQHEIYALSF